MFCYMLVCWHLLESAVASGRWLLLAKLGKSLNGLLLQVIRPRIWLMFFVHVDGSRSSSPWPLCRGMDASEVSCVHRVGQQSSISIFVRPWLRDNLKIDYVCQWGTWSLLVLVWFGRGLVFEFSSVYCWSGCAWVWISVRHLKMKGIVNVKYYLIKMPFRVCSLNQHSAGEETW